MTDNTAIGAGALGGSSAVDNTVIIGSGAGAAAMTADADGTVAIGYQAGAAITSGQYNTFLGYQAGTAQTDNDKNVVIGYGAMAAADSGENANVVIGYNAGTSINSTSADANVIIGHNAGTGGNNAAMDSCVVIGEGAMNSTGTNAVTPTIAIGTSALTAMTTGAGNTAIGHNAMLVHTTGARNIAIGLGAMDDTDSDVDSLVSSDNIFIGYDAGGGTWGNGQTNQNVAIGNYAMDAVLTNTPNNVAIGHQALSALTSGNNNTCVGHAAGATLTTGPYNICIGSAVVTSDVDVQDQYTFGRSCSNTANSTVLFGVASTTLQILLNGSGVSWSATSDERLKENIETSTAGLSFINDLRPVTYNWKKQKDIDNELHTYKQNVIGEIDDDAPCQGGTVGTYGTINHGFVAQEVKAVIDNHSEIKDGFAMWNDGGASEIQGTSEGTLVPILVKAVQELSAKVTALENA